MTLFTGIPPHVLARRLAAAGAAFLVLGLAIGTIRNPEFWFSADQQGDRLSKRGEFEKAANTYRDPIRSGNAWFRAGEFKKASAAYMRSTTPEAHFNRGNALVFQGLYKNAIDAYDAALVKRANWPDAIANREIAVIRAEQTKLEGGDMTGGQMGADDIVFEKGKKGGENDQTETVEGGKEMSNDELQALWLKRIQTKPADFLRSKFAYQAQSGVSGEESEPGS